MQNKVNKTIIKMLESNFSIQDIIDSIDVTKYEISKAISILNYTGSLTIRQAIDLDD